MEDRAVGLVGRKIAVRLTNVEARGVEIIGTLEEVRDDGIVLSEIGELGPGPTMFCPWDSLRRVRERPPWLGPPHEEPDEAYQEQEFFELREATPEETTLQPPERRRRASAQNLYRVVPVAQRQTVGEVVVALTSLELFGGGLGILRYRISQGRVAIGGGFGIPEPELVIRDESGRELSWALRGSHASESEADGEVEVRDLPEAGELEVEVTRLATFEFDEEAGEEVVTDFYDGPWTSRFSV